MKFKKSNYIIYKIPVALFTRAWIEIDYKTRNSDYPTVALFTRAWIEMVYLTALILTKFVALFTRAWIEIHRYVII